MAAHYGRVPADTFCLAVDAPQMTILHYVGGYQATIQPAENFNSERSAMKLRKAMRGIGTDEKVIIDVLVGHSNSQRQEIKRKYKSLYGRDLVEDISAELGGHFEDLCIALLTPQLEFIVDCLHEAVKGLGTDEICIIEILCTHNKKELDEIKKYYKEKYQSDLEEGLSSDTSGAFQRVIRCLVAAEREEDNEVDLDLAEMEAQRLYDAGVGRLGADEELFTMILCNRSQVQLQATIDAYERIAGHSLTAALRAEFTGPTRDVFVAIVSCLHDKKSFLATQINRAINGLGTDDAALIRLLVSRSELDLEDIKEAYLRQFNKDLAEAISNDTSGDFRKGLLRILQP